MGGVKVALEIAEPYAISGVSGKQNIPRVETEVSYATKFKNGSVHAWLGGIWQQDTRSSDAVYRAGHHNTTLGVAPGVNTQVGPFGVMLSGYFGQGLGMYSVQDGRKFAAQAVDVQGDERQQWGFLAQTTYQLTDSIRLGANYGRSDQSSNSDNLEDGDYDGIMKTHEAVVGQVNYNLNKFTQVTLEYIWAREAWVNRDNKTTSHQVALGTVFFW
jgi:hypothetical protein